VLEIAQREVPARTVQVKFSGGLKWDETSHLIRQIDPTIPDYGGIPSPEIDAAWQELISSELAKISPGLRTPTSY
jgi:hypothetical protein